MVRGERWLEVRDQAEEVESESDEKNKGPIDANSQTLTAFLPRPRRVALLRGQGLCLFSVPSPWSRQRSRAEGKQHEEERGEEEAPLQRPHLLLRRELSHLIFFVIQSHFFFASFSSKIEAFPGSASPRVRSSDRDKERASSHWCIRARCSSAAAGR